MATFSGKLLVLGSVSSTPIRWRFFLEHLPRFFSWKRTRICQVINIILEKKLLLISINFSLKTNHICLKKWLMSFFFPSVSFASISMDKGTNLENPELRQQYPWLCQDKTTYANKMIMTFVIIYVCLYKLVSKYIFIHCCHVNWHWFMFFGVTKSPFS